MTENTDADGGESLADKMKVSRRKVLAALGTSTGAAVLGSASTSNGGEQLSMGGVTNLTEQKRRETYVTSPSSAFDPSALKENEMFWVSDTGEVGIKGPNGPEHPGLGSASQPVPAVHTEQLDNVYDYICESDAQFDAALQEAAAGTTSEIAIKLGNREYTPSVSLPVDITDTQVTLVGEFPRLPNRDKNPDLNNPTADGGSIINCGGGTGLFTGHHVRGCEFRNFWVRNCSASAFDFGSTDSIGIYFSEFKNVYGIDVKELLTLTNIQHIYGEHVKAFNAERVLNIINDHIDHSGSNSVFVDPYLYGTSTSSGDKPDGGIRLRGIDTDLNYVTLVRPQTNQFSGTNGTGSNLLLSGTSGASAVKGITVIGGDFEGATKRCVDASMLKSSRIEFESNSEATDYDLYFDANSQSNWFHSQESSHTPYSGNARNMLSGIVTNPEGQWYGTVYNAGPGSAELYMGRDVGTYYINFDTTTTFAGQDIDVDGLQMAVTDLSANNGSEVGEVKRALSDNRLYEWDGTAWQGVTVANTI